MKIMKKLKYPILIFAILNILDAIFTYIVLTRTSPLNELSPIYKGLFEIFGVGTSLALLKTLGIIFMIYIYYVLTGENMRHIMDKTLKYINVFYIFIVLNNLYCVFRTIYIL